MIWMPNAMGRLVSRLIQAATLDPPGIPPSAVLLVRRLGDPLPRTLRGDSARATVPPKWELALREALERECRRAARPAEGPVPASANAVLFIDRSELLACLARDLVGSAGSEWWWQTLFNAVGRGSLPQLVSEWLHEPHHIPGALAALIQLRTAEPVLRALSTGQVTSLFVAMVRRAGLAFPPAATATSPPLVAVPPAEPDLAQSDRSSTSSTVFQARAASNPPWLRVLGEDLVPPSLPRAHQQLLGVALVLQRAPLAARSRAFRAELLEWQRADPALVSPGASQTLRQEGTFSSPPRVSPSPVGLSEPITHRPPSAEQPDQIVPKTVAPLSIPLSSQQLEPGHTPIEADVLPDRPPSESLANEVRVDQRPTLAAITPDGEWIRTELGGVFFLVTVVERLQLLDLLETHFQVESNLESWDWIALLARGLLGKTSRYRDDAIWGALDLLAGHPGEPRAYQFTGSAFYQLPKAWYAMPDRLPRFRCMVGRKREQLWHPALFLLEDRIIHPGKIAPAERRLPKSRRKLARARCDPGLEPAAVPGDLHRFLEFLLPYLRWRLTRALSLETGDDLVAELLVRDADLSLTRTHVDLRMPLESVRLSVRLSGLDQDPGWAPAFGRVIAFHFTSQPL